MFEKEKSVKIDHSILYNKTDELLFPEMGKINGDRRIVRQIISSWY